MGLAVVILAPLVFVVVGVWVVFRDPQRQFGPRHNAARDERLVWNPDKPGREKLRVVATPVEESHRVPAGDRGLDNVSPEKIVPPSTNRFMSRHMRPL